MKEYIEPELEIIRLVSQNVITLTSTPGADQEGDDFENLVG